MAANNKEIEIQVQVEHIKPLLGFLKKNAELIGESSQIDRYFTPQHRNFLDKYPTEEWLRLRDAGGKFTITYKKWKYDENDQGLYADEYETIVQDINQMENIFKSVDMKEVATVNKISRQTWIYKDYEVVIDNIKGLGQFVELEYCGKSKSPDHKKINAQMIKFLKDVGCGKVTQNHSGYPIMVMFPEKVKYYEF
jgi:predicted adenylyl cyclase CyaB